MRKQRNILIGVAACILLFVLFGQNAFCCWNTTEYECDDNCFYLTPDLQQEYGYASILFHGLGGWHCYCHTNNPVYTSCEEEVIGDCADRYHCSQEDCEGTCVYQYTVDKDRCLVEE